MILVTGGAGFIGSRAVGRLLAAGETVHAVDDFSLGRRELLGDSLAHPRFRLHELDVNAPAFAELVARERPSRIWHLAANSDISTGSEQPRQDLDRTFLTTFHVLEAMRHAGVAELVFASSSAIYGEAAVDLDEDHGPLEPISQYGAAKLAGEAYVSTYAHLYRMRAWVFRFPNVVGPNLTHGVIHDLVEKLARDPTVLRVLGDGTQDKPYLHVDDLLDAIESALGEPAAPMATYNIAGEGSTTVREIAELVREEMGLGGARIEYGSGKRGWPGDVPRFGYDTRRIRALGWRPERDSRAAVRAAIRAKVEACKRSS